MKIINHVGLSSGKDSTALWGWIINDSGYDKSTIRGSFCDTENEYDEVYDQIMDLDKYGQARGVAPIRWLTSMGFLDLCIKKMRFPAAKARFCTEHLKILPTLHYFEELWLDGFEILAHSGVRGDESTERGLLSEYGEGGILKTPVRRPLLKWTLADVWEAHRRYGLPINPLYQEGWKRVGCRLCCMSNKSDVRRTAKKRPWVIQVYKDWEKLVGVSRTNGGAAIKTASFFHAKTVPPHLRSVTVHNDKGEKFNVTTIQDVANWSDTLRGGKQKGFEFMFEEDDAHLPCQAGYCE